ncbi:tigger transposable element-derived protein 4-like [Leptidea sinapis]|uniref:tigger transposable element-derived protein 4-like n=1 Tax=Leptidea sinapis TaxID=189913 RepID=UPI0021C4C8C9|nr:tigger transposable element-derived protein 4-like [Leptidea sinapis]
MTPDRTLKFKGENCSGGKMSKTRLTIMVAANMTGSCKRKLLVIGKSKKPRCFKNIRSLPVTYENNVKSWMTSEIFEKWLRNWDAELKANNKKVLLLVDNCPAPPAVTNLKCIKLVFLSPNVTSVLQPMDQGVIRCLKSHYRRLQVLKLIQSIDSNNQNSFTVLDAILMISEAWEKVSQKTIANCFGHAGFKDLTSLITRTSDDVIDDDEEDNISLAQLAQNLRPALSTTETDEFIDVDQSIAICAPATEDDIAREVQEENENDQEDSEEQFTVPTLIDGLNAVSVLRKIVLFNEEFHMQVNCDDTLIKFQRELQNVYARQKCFKQTKISDFMHTKMILFFYIIRLY